MNEKFLEELGIEIKALSSHHEITQDQTVALIRSFPAGNRNESLDAYMNKMLVSKIAGLLEWEITNKGLGSAVYSMPGHGGSFVKYMNIVVMSQHDFRKLNNAISLLRSVIIEAQTNQV